MKGEKEMLVEKKIRKAVKRLNYTHLKGEYGKEANAYINWISVSEDLGTTIELHIGTENKNLIDSVRFFVDDALLANFSIKELAAFMLAHILMTEDKQEEK